MNKLPEKTQLIYEDLALPYNVIYMPDNKLTQEYLDKLNNRLVKTFTEKSNLFKG